MRELQALWHNQGLHFWAIDNGAARTTPDGDADRFWTADEVESRVVPEGELRQTLGDLWDTLLASAVPTETLNLRVPIAKPVEIPPTPETSTAVTETKAENALRTVTVPSLVISPADAVDVLTTWPDYAPHDARRGSSFRYWAKLGQLVLELLARQRLVPDLHQHAGGKFSGFWRVIVDDNETYDRIHRLILAMPPICRAMDSQGETAEAPRLIEEFLWATVDALVRRCLEQDELAHALQDRPEVECNLAMRWLRSLIGVNPSLKASPEESRAIYHYVRQWLSTIEPAAGHREFRTCLQLIPPDDLEGVDQTERAWRLAVKVQSTGDRQTVLDAETFIDSQTSDPAILRRRSDIALEQLRTDIAAGAKFFPPLAPCAEAGGPLDVSLTISEAYQFLRDASPMLEAEGLGIIVPRWWRETRPKLRMRMRVGSAGAKGGVAPATMQLDSLVDYNWKVAIGDDELGEDELKELALAKEPLIRIRGQWTELQRSELDTALRFLEKNPGGTNTIMQTLRTYYWVDDADTGLPVAGLQAEGWVDQILNAALLDERLDSVPPPSNFNGVLRPYQLRGLSWLSFLSRYGLGACLADDMGLGKTIQLIALWLHERREGTSPGPTLLVVPMSVVGNWNREIMRFGPSLRVMVHHGGERLIGRDFIDQVNEFDVVISTYGLAHRDRDHLTQVQWHRIALDEAQNIKNAAAKQAAAIRSLKATHRVALTGTPIENRLSELWSILDFLNPQYLGNATDFRRRFAVPIERYHDDDRTERLRHLIRPFVLRRLKDDPRVQVDLPPKMEMKVLCNLTREQAALYQALVDDMLAQIDNSGGMQRRGLILATLVKLKQICNHPAQFLGEKNQLLNRSGKCDRIVGMMEEVVAEGHFALVFTQFREMGHLLQNVLQETMNREVLFLHGGTPQKHRDLMIERFQKSDPNVPIFILSLRAGGFGLNLTAANHVFHYDRWWNPAVEDQATDRAHRIGQEKQVQVHKFLCIGTLEERIDGLIEQKRSLAENIVGTGEEWLTELTTDALRDLFALSKDAVADE